MRELLQIGEIARLVGVSTKTIRYYHEINLLAEPERTESGYRLYNAQHLLRLQRIRRLRSLGLSLDRIRAILVIPRKIPRAHCVPLSLLWSKTFLPRSWNWRNAAPCSKHSWSVIALNLKKKELSFSLMLRSKHSLPPT